jgi:hypothetical protein
MPSSIYSCSKPSSRSKRHAKVGLVLLLVIVLAALGVCDQTYIAQTKKDFGDFHQQVQSTALRFEQAAVNFRFP